MLLSLISPTSPITKEDIVVEPVFFLLKTNKQTNHNTLNSTTEKIVVVIIRLKKRLEKMYGFALCPKFRSDPFGTGEETIFFVGYRST